MSRRSASWSAGDAAYNDVHLYLAESDAGGRRSWLTALDTIEKLSPRAVVAGHKRPERADDPKILEETRQYIRDFDALAARTATPLELYTEMTARYPQPCQPRSAVGLRPRGEGLTTTHGRY